MVYRYILATITQFVYVCSSVSHGLWVPLLTGGMTLMCTGAYIQYRLMHDIVCTCIPSEYVLSVVVT